MKSSISEVFAWEALDSRGHPTVGCEVVLSGGAHATVIVPSGASTGSHEVHELRDGGSRYEGLGVRRAVGGVTSVLGPAVRGLDAHRIEEVDAALLAADGTPHLSSLGGNAVLGVSIATLLAAAREVALPLHRYLDPEDEPPQLPLPMINIISGGAHAGRLLDIQDVLAVPVGAETIVEAVEWIWRTRRAACRILAERGHDPHLVADEGGLAAPLPTNTAALDLVCAAIERAGLRPGSQIALAVDVAANQLVQLDGEYRLGIEDRRLRPDEWIAELTQWCRDYPIISLEDPLHDNDWASWTDLTSKLDHIQLLGDDLFATHLDRLDYAIDNGIANAILVKPNQAGTITAAAEVARRAHQAGYVPVVSARSGDSEDSYLADLAVAWRAPQIKVGSLTRSERNAKWNRLLQIAARYPDHTFAHRGGRTCIEIGHDLVSPPVASQCPAAASRTQRDRDTTQPPTPTKLDSANERNHQV